ncbi:MAG: hypothetical protein P4M02_04560 [Clostridia bacterium]|nr:hypothetical protein [Clostridia bacterium]
MDAVSALSTCLPSITLPAHRKIIDHARHIFIDEISQVLRFLASDSHCRTRDFNNEQVYDKLRQIVAKAECVIVADAGVDRRTIEFLEQCRPGERFRIIEMRQRRDGIEAQFRTGGAAACAVIGECLAELEAGGKVWIAVESKSRTKVLEKLFSDYGYNVLAVNADNKGNPVQAAFLAEVERESLKYDAVIASPVIGSGISVEHRETGPYFTLGAAIFGGHRITPADAAQMLRRVRYLKQFELAIIPNNAVGKQSPDGVIAAWRAAAKLENTAGRENGFTGLKAGILADDDNHRSDFAAGLLWQLDRAGWTLTRGEAGEPDKDLGAAIGHARENVEDEHREALFAAPSLTEGEASNLEAITNRTTDENNLLEAHRIRQALGVDVINEETVDFWDDGRAPRRLDRFSAFRGIIPSFDDGGENLARRRFWRATARAYAMLFEGIDLLNGRITEDTASIVIDRVVARRHLLAHLGLVPAKYGTWEEDKDGHLRPFKEPKNPRQELAAIIDLMGLKWRRREGTTTPTLPEIDLGNYAEGGGKTPSRHRFYEVTPESVMEIANWADRRNAARAADLAATADLLPAAPPDAESDDGLEHQSSDLPAPIGEPVMVKRVVRFTARGPMLLAA